MTRTLNGAETAARIAEAIPGSVEAVAADWVVVAPEKLFEVATFLRDDPDFDCRYLVSVTAVDRIDHFEVVYHLASLRHNQLVMLKAVIADHDHPEIAAVTPLWKGADLQECEAYDLMGIRFSGHPRLQRIFLWEGFAGFPLRKDFLHLPGGVKPGLPLFPGVRPEEATDG